MKPGQNNRHFADAVECTFLADMFLHFYAWFRESKLHHHVVNFTEMYLNYCITPVNIVKYRFLFLPELFPGVYIRHTMWLSLGGLPKIRQLSRGFILFQYTHMIQGLIMIQDLLAWINKQFVWTKCPHTAIQITWPWHFADGIKWAFFIKKVFIVCISLSLHCNDAYDLNIAL